MSGMQINGLNDSVANLTSGLLDKALNLEQADEQSVVEQPKQEPATTPQAVATPEVVEQQTTTQEQPKVFEIPDDALVKVKIDGKETTVPYKEYRDGVQREAHYTQRLQTLAAQRKQSEEQIVNMYAQLQQQAQVLQAQKDALAQQYSNDPIRKALEQAMQAKQPQRTPDQIASLGDIDNVLQAKLNELNTQYQEKFKQLEETNQRNISETEAKMVRAKAAEQFTSGLNQVLAGKDAEILRQVIPDPQMLDAIVRFNVGKMDPESIPQGIEFAQRYVKEWAENVRSKTLAERKVEAAQQAQKQLEPPTSGSAPGPKKPDQHISIFKKDGTIDWKGIGQRAHDLASQLEA